MPAPAAADTIAALASAPGRGGIGVLRISGPQVSAIARSITGDLPEPRHARLCDFCRREGNRSEQIDEGIALFFPGPNSFTGEDVLELHAHGGPVILDCLLEEILRLGARLARPGEFSERAFLNGKLDLAQAEAIADLIDSGSRDAARGALRSLKGEFSRRVESLVDSLTELRCYVEASIDFPEEEIDFLSDGRVADSLEDLLTQIESLRSAASQGSVLREGINVVIAGRPNAGKSSLLNRLAGQERAIVTDIPGTTRDVLREHIQIDGMPLHVIDTAGLRDSPDEIESEGIRRARLEISEADHLLLVIDSSADAEPVEAELHAHFGNELDWLPDITIVLNKIDLGTLPGGFVSDLPQRAIAVSAKNGDGMDILREHLKECAGYRQAGEGSFTARRRHLDAIDRARQSVATGRRQLQQHGAGELLAEDLRQAQLALGEITGQVSSDELLGRIFASFCIGK